MLTLLNIKVIAVLLALPLAGLAIYACWTHQQHSRVVAVKHGGARMISPDDAAQMQQFKDR